MAKRKLSEKQLAAITILAQPNRGGYETYEQVAEAVGVTRNGLGNWRKQDEFNEELKRQIMRNTLDRLPDIMDSIPDHIIRDGNAALFRTLLQAHNMLREQVEVTSNTNNTSVDEIRAQVAKMRALGSGEQAQTDEEVSQ